MRDGLTPLDHCIVLSFFCLLWCVVFFFNNRDLKMIIQKKILLCYL